MAAVAAAGAAKKKKKKTSGARLMSQKDKARPRVGGHRRAARKRARSGLRFAPTLDGDGAGGSALYRLYLGVARRHVHWAGEGRAGTQDDRLSEYRRVRARAADMPSAITTQAITT